jgi:hypothetical protein
LDAFKKVDTKEAINAVQQLTMACKDNLKLGYWDIKVVAKGVDRFVLKPKIGLGSKVE